MPAPKTATAPALRVELVEDDGDWSALTDAQAVIERAAAAVGRAPEVRVRPGFVTVALSSDAHVASLNAQFRAKPAPTNVLSFPAGPAAPDGYLGDIVLAQETVACEARELAIPLAHHVQHLTVHGILHLLGFDHDANADAEQMEAIEIKILSTLGVANPYTGALETGRKH